MIYFYTIANLVCFALFVYMLGIFGFWCFVQIFGMVDNYFQDRYFKSLEENKK